MGGSQDNQIRRSEVVSNPLWPFINPLFGSFCWDPYSLCFCVCVCKCVFVRVYLGEDGGMGLRKVCFCQSGWSPEGNGRDVIVCGLFGWQDLRIGNLAILGNLSSAWMAQEVCLQNETLFEYMKKLRFTSTGWWMLLYLFVTTERGIFNSRQARGYGLRINPNPYFIIFIFPSLQKRLSSVDINGISMFQLWRKNVLVYVSWD